MTHSLSVAIRDATTVDVPILAKMNQQLIRDEGHRNAMSIVELQNRMATWLSGEYSAVIAEQEGDTVGYALFQENADHVYVRQLFVSEHSRRHGVGKSLVTWINQHADDFELRLRIDVLVGNQQAIEFWHALGFKDYCITMERES
ncbi:MAG: GNAT family N-acetyltransferase [Planctomycetaceae bacterium]|nr:GNAT family N-acetyltransferase [Planctomycetaceae bacterium]